MVLTAIRYAPTDPKPWEALACLASDPPQRLGTQDDARARMMLRNLLPLVAHGDALASKRTTIYGQLLRWWIAKGDVEPCAVLTEMYVDRAESYALLQMSYGQVSPPCFLKPTTVGYMMMMHAMRLHILPKSREFWELANAFKMGGGGIRSVHLDLSPRKARTLHRIARRFELNGRTDVAAKMRARLSLHGTGASTVAYVEMILRAPPSVRFDADHDDDNEKIPTAVSVRKVVADRRQLAERDDVPPSLMVATISCDPTKEFVALIRAGEHAWTFVVSRDLAVLRT